MDITDRETIEGCLERGHFDVLMPDGTLDDYDNAVPSYYAKTQGLGECVDTNGSETFIKNIAEDGTVIVDFIVYDREFENGHSWKEKTFRACGKVFYKETDWPVYRVEKLEVQE